MSSTYTVTVDIDVANQTVTASDNSITVPTSNYDIVTFDGKSCIKAKDGGTDWPTFYFGENIESFSCKIFLQSVNGFTFFAGGDTNSTRYGLVYYPYGYWHNPDRATFDPNNDLVGTWVTVTYSNTDKTLTFDNGTTQFTRTIDDYLINFYIACFDNRYNIYLTDLEFEVSIPSSKYLNGTGLSEVWANTKNYISAQLLGKSNIGHTHTKSEITDFPTIPTKTSDLTNDSGFLTSHQDLSDYVPRSGGAVITGEALGRNVDDDNLRILGGSAWNTGAQLQLCGKNMSGGFGGTFTLYANSGDNICALQGTPSGALTWGSKNIAMQEATIPRSGGAVMTGSEIAYYNDFGGFALCGGSSWSSGGVVQVLGASNDNVIAQGIVRFLPTKNGTYKDMVLYPDGTWTWNGTAVQVTSDQRYKQQISEIDDKLLDAWEDVELVQFKYNESVDTKGKSARLHTGYVVQQINKACTSHGVDITQYGLFCHEEYPEETKEIEVKQKDGTKTKKTKVIREANEHYSLRYTEALIVECKYLRRCIARLTARIEELEKGDNVK